VRLRCRREPKPTSAEAADPDAGAGADAEKGVAPEEAKRLLAAVRFPHLAHEELIKAASDQILTQAGAQEQVLHALSAKLSRHEHAASAFQSERPPRLSTQPGYRGPSLPSPRGNSPKQPARPLSPARNDALVPWNDAALDAQVGSVQASAEQPVIFERRVGDFDEGGALYWLGTSGKTHMWRNPMSLGHVLALASGVGFGKLEDAVGRKVVNLRSNNAEGSYFGVDLLGERRLILQGYCLRNRDSTSHALTSWACQGSEDGSTWVTIDEQRNQSSLRRASATAYFQVRSDTFFEASRPYRCFRILQLGPNSSGSNNLVLSGLELYGCAIAGAWP